MSSSSQFRGGIKSIQRGIVSISPSGSSGTATISAVNTAKSELRFLGGGVFNASGATASARISLTDSLTITATAIGGNPSSGTSISWELTEWY